MGNFKQQITSKKVDLDTVYPEYRKISEAPTLADLEDESEIYARDLDYLIQKERDTLYKSQDKWGNIWLIQNPAVWKLIEVKGKLFKYRPKPQLATLDDKSNLPAVVVKAILMDDLL